MRPTINALNIRGGPGTVYDVVGSAQAKDTLVVLSRLSDNSWFEVKDSAGKRGWVSAALVEAKFDLSTVPVANVIPPTPTVRPSPTPDEAALLATTQRLVCEGSPLGSDSRVGTAKPGKAVVCGKILFSLPGNLAATDRTYLQYVIRVFEGRGEIERCPYNRKGSGSATNWLVRNVVWWAVQVTDVLTGKVIAEHTFDGPRPPACPQARGFSGSEEWMDGGPPLTEPIVEWLRTYVK